MNSHDTVPFNLILVLVPLEAVLIERLGGPPPLPVFQSYPGAGSLETILIERLGGPPTPPPPSYNHILVQVPLETVLI